jgi:tyrosinase
MAQFDISETVNNILSNRKGTADLPGEALVGLTSRDADAPKRQFNPFSLVEMHRAVAMASELIKIAEEAEGDGLDVAIGATAVLGELMGEASGLVGDLGDDLVTAVSSSAQRIVDEVGAAALGLIGLRQQALMLFITHYSPAHEQIKIEPLDQREPNLVSRAGALATPPEENRVSFWREDAQLNDHHGRWHAVNPTGAQPQPDGNLPILGDRHGELFVYMHIQMIARYDAERLSAGLPRVKPFDDYRAKLHEGYVPGNKMGNFADDGKFTPFRARPAGVQLEDLSAFPPFPPSTIADQERFRDALREAARLGYYPLLADSGQIDGESPDVSSDNFGNIIEASIASLDWPDKEDPNSERNGQNYGNLHGSGHLHIAYFDDNQVEPSVMLNLSATTRDPMFWRWHKHIDAIVQVWREKLGEEEPHDFSDGPPVTIRSEDIIVCRQEGLPADVDGGKLGAEAFGYSEVATENRWDADFSSGSATATLSKGADDEKRVTVTTTAELLTEMRKRTIYPLNPETKKAEPEDIDYLSHEDFSYFIRLQNNSDQAQEVTVRIFLAPEPWVEDSTAWIEMDRFMQPLEGSERTVVFRPARLSAVIRKPAVGHEELEGTKPRDPATIWCDCGWPYTLLLPRGTREGLDFRLLVMVSGDDLAMDNTGEKCTSMGYCGVERKPYPDKRPMGYPFDRPLPYSISSIIDKHENWASRKIRIRCRS